MFSFEHGYLLDFSEHLNYHVFYFEFEYANKKIKHKNDGNDDFAWKTLELTDL